VNCDVIFLQDILSSIEIIRHWRKSFLIAGQCWHLEIHNLLDFEDISWERNLRNRVTQEGELREFWATDFFVFTNNLYDDIPPFALGRAYFDNWLIWKAIKTKSPVIDVTKAVTVIHQRHDYSHVKGGKNWAHDGDEAKNNVNLAGGLSRRYCLLDSTHFLSKEGIKSNILNKFSWEMVKIIKTRFRYYILDKTRGIRHRLGLRQELIRILLKKK